MIKGIVTAVPKNIVKNTDEAFIKMTGVRERRIATTQTTGTLGVTAMRNLLASMAWNVEDLGAIIFVTQSPDVRMPAMACHMAGMIGAHCPAFDVNMACSGYVYGLWLAHKLRTRVLLLAGDTVSRMCDPNDKATYPLFGDAVSATAVDSRGGADDNGHAHFVMGTDGDGFNDLTADPLIRMNGAEVMNFALKAVPKLVHDTTKNANVDWYFFHQANAMILRQVCKKSKIAPEKMPMNLAKYGNTSSASIPLLMCDSEATIHLTRHQNRVALFGFGAGFSWGGCMLDLEPLKVCEVVQAS